MIDMHDLEIYHNGRDEVGCYCMDKLWLIGSDLEIYYKGRIKRDMMSICWRSQKNQGWIEWELSKSLGRIGLENQAETIVVEICSLTSDEGEYNLLETISSSFVIFDVFSSLGKVFG